VFDRVLIANRGEIAVRVARTLHRLGIEAIAVYSDADARAPHVRAADRAVHIGPTPPQRSYLDVERVVDVALHAGAEAVHPGYGFLSESPEFARACAAAGLVFVGPGPEAMALLGDKVAGKEAAAAAGVPVLPGLSGERLSNEEIEAWAAGAELPILLKAVAGGGGKGMRVVTDLAELPAALAAARREAVGAFGDDRLLVERYLEASRHIEVQVLADSHGNAVHLGERECSLQRRHQKVVEESPSPVVGPELRERMGAAAVTLAQSCGYVNAGTVELIAERDEPGAFFFLAVEARLYAEDPANGFLPSAGRIVAYREPAGIRVDSGVEEGVEVGTDYDPMLAKLVAHAPTREQALSGLERGLADLVLLGPATNAAYLRALLARPEVRTGEIDTGLIERLGAAVAPPAPEPVLAAVALAELLGPPPSDDPWDARDGWRQGEPAWVRSRLRGPDGEVEVAIRRDANALLLPIRDKVRSEAWVWRIGEESGAFAIEGEMLTVGDETRRIGIHRDGDAVWLLDGAAEPVRFEIAAEAGGASTGAGGGSLEAPMPGVVIDVRAEPGAEVEEGEVLVVLESMKMELSVQSPRPGVVAEVLVGVGDQVARGQTLIALASGEEAG
jgi:acetyl-CoA/propionyl-CoA carboxylase biotin carboxyl carrier protein